MGQAHDMKSENITAHSSNKQDVHEHHSLLDDVMDYSHKSWSHVLAGHSSMAEKAVVGSEALAGAAATVASAVVLRKFFPAVEAIFPEASTTLEKDHWIPPAEAWKDTY